MRIDVGPTNTEAMEQLLNEARSEADALRKQLQKFERIVLSTRLIMGHELKKPTTAIMGYLDLLLDEMKNSTPEEVAEYLTKARGECDLLNELNVFFLELLKVESYNDVLQGSRVDVRSFVEDVISHVASSPDAKARIKTRLAPNIRNFHLNPSGFKIILSNVIENALSYSSDGSEVLVDVRRMPDKRGMEERELLAIKVTDHGVGIAPADVKRIFAPFVRLHENIGSGSGLGLTLVRSLVELYGGEVNVKSTEGEGTTVHVTLPEAAEEKSQKGGA